MSALHNYARFPGMGDLPGDSSNPNSPDYVEPEYGVEDAEGDVAAQLVEADEVGGLLSDVLGATGLLGWIAHNVEVPAVYLPHFRILDRRVRELTRAVDARMEANR